VLRADDLRDSYVVGLVGVLVELAVQHEDRGIDRRPSRGHVDAGELTEESLRAAR
jgi:hypothetical protein